MRQDRRATDVARFLLLFLTIVGSHSAFSQFVPRGVWSEGISIAPLSKAHPPAVANHARTLRLDADALKRLLADAPREFTPAVQAANVVLELPLPDGSMKKFRVAESPIMEAGLARLVPETRTYCGQGVDDPLLTTRFSWTPEGFRAIVLSGMDAVFIAPIAPGDAVNYVSYDSRDFAGTVSGITCGAAADRPPTAPLTPQFTTGSQLRTYRLALAATGEFTAQFGGGNATTALNGTLVPLVNAINAIYERETTIRFVLVSGELSIIYTDGATDPYDNSSQNTMLTQNTANLDATILSANYDIGHVLGGITLSPGFYQFAGVAGLGVVCTAGLKGRGATRMGGGTGSEVIFVSGVAHEWGHQFNAGHTFNGTTSGCSGQRSSGDAYEPGSGSTIMSYTTCGTENLQPTPLAGFPTFFHTGSINRILTHATGTGNCAALTATGNSAPTITALSDYNVPQATPFVLTATASDINGDALTYIWEQYDLGAASPPNTDDGTRPLFRSYLPSAAGGTRLFPSLTYILNNANVPPQTYQVSSTTYTTGEALATTNRTLHFHMTVRDNRSGGGGVQDAAMQVAVTTSSGPFAVTSPNTGISWPALSTQTVTWNEAGTSASPVSCSSVRILLSTDGGTTFPLTLAASTPNNGSASVSVPNAQTTTARVKIEGIGNIFFDVSDANFTIGLPVPIQLASFSAQSRTGGGVLLRWATLSEVNNYGFEVQRRQGPGGAFQTLAGSFVPGHGTTSAPHSYTAIDSTVAGGTWQYRLSQIDLDGTVHLTEPVEVKVLTGVDGAPAATDFFLEQNFPNPFNPSTEFRYRLPAGGRVTLKVYDQLGKEVATLADGQKPAGSYALVFDGSGLASGVYLCRLTLIRGDGGKEFASRSRKFVLLR